MEEGFVHMEIITEKKTKKTAPRYTIICMSIILSMLLLTGCQNSFDSEDKLIDAIESYNLQGINEVLNDDPELDLNQLPHKPYSTTVYKDENKALSYAIGSEEDILMALLKSGRVDAYSEDEITYIDSAIFLYGLETCEELIKNGAKIDKGSEPTLDHYLRLLSYRNDKN
ncbi:MAG: hypothetical protein IJI74_02305 [Firmicutes bacterium]|nr:hypothetical protein [Bacillota bacterium]